MGAFCSLEYLRRKVLKWREWFCEALLVIIPKVFVLFQCNDLGRMKTQDFVKGYDFLDLCMCWNVGAGCCYHVM